MTSFFCSILLALGWPTPGHCGPHLTVPTPQPRVPKPVALALYPVATDRRDG